MEDFGITNYADCDILFVTQCTVESSDQRFGETYRLHQELSAFIYLCFLVFRPQHTYKRSRVSIHDKRYLGFCGYMHIFMHTL